MKMRKKIIAMLLVGALAVAVLCACGKDDAKEPDTKQDTNQAGQGTDDKDDANKTDADKSGGGADANGPSAKTASYDEVVAYLKEGGVIADENNAIDINVTEGYVTDNTGGEFAVAEVADKALALFEAMAE